MKKWIGFTLGVVLTLGALAAVGWAGYHVGFAQGARSVAQNTRDRPQEFPRPPGFDKDFNRTGPDFSEKGFDFHGFDRRHRGIPSFLPIRGLVRATVLGLLLLSVYVIYRKSGWQFVRTNLPPENGPASQEITGKKKKRKSNS